jgi:predicted DNA-binding protein with PD1-like motif
MEYRKFGNRYFVRVDRGEEVVSKIKEFCKDNNIVLGSISGIGAANKVVVGLFDTAKKEYFSKEFCGDHEITNLTGNITTQNGEVYLHIHATLCDINCNAFGGHLNSAVISATCELVIDKKDGIVERQMDKQVGINLQKFTN